jgi:hypothetical protein
VIGLLSCVDPQVGFEVTFLVEGSLAFLVRTHVLFVTKMSLYMNFKSLDSTVRLVATFVSASVLLYFDMCL